jgi:very-short-patch-repair endonuclease
MTPPDTDRGTRERRIAELAHRQLGLISREQLGACGLGRGAIAHGVRSGRLYREDRGVYAVGRPAVDPMARHLAAILALPGEGWLRGTSAGTAWGIVPTDSGHPVRLCVVDGGGRSRPGVDVRRVASLSPGDRTKLGPLPVTGLARTVVDLGEDLDADAFERAFAEATVVHRLTPGAVRHALDRTTHRPGTAAVRRMLALAEGPRHTRTAIERVLLRLVREAGLPVPRTNVRVGRYVVDALWPEERVIGEADGFASHGTRRGFEDDRRRDAELQARGFVVTRMTWRQLTEDRVATAARLAAILAVRRPTGR